MGTNASTPSESLEAIQARSQQSQVMAANLKKRKKLYTDMVKRVLNSGFQSSFCKLPDCAILSIVQFLAPELKTALLVSPEWHVRVLQCIDAGFSQVESQFALVHSHLLTFKKGFLDINPISVSGRKGIRGDRVMVAEPLPILIGHTVKLRYTYRTFSSSYSYKAEFKLDCVPKAKRKVWTHRDECRFHGEDQRRSYTQQVPPICEGDEFEFAVNWYNLLGLVRLDTVQWQPPVVQDTRVLLKSIQLSPEFPRQPTDESEGIEKKLYLYNVARHCEVELSQTEWYEAEYYVKQNQVYKYDHFMPFLRLLKSEFAGVDVTISRNTYKVENPGIVPGSLNKVGIGIEIKHSEQKVTTEVKRMGFVYDRHKNLELRVGDTFTLYISRGG